MLTAKKDGRYIFLIRCGLEVSLVSQRKASGQKKLEKNKKAEIIRGNRCPFLMQTYLQFLINQKIFTVFSETQLKI